MARWGGTTHVRRRTASWSAGSVRANECSGTRPGRITSATLGSAMPAATRCARSTARAHGGRMCSAGLATSTDSSSWTVKLLWSSSDGEASSVPSARSDHRFP